MGGLKGAADAEQWSPFHEREAVGPEAPKMYSPSFRRATDIHAVIMSAGGASATGLLPMRLGAAGSAGAAGMGAAGAAGAAGFSSAVGSSSAAGVGRTGIIGSAGAAATLLPAPLTRLA